MKLRLFVVSLCVSVGPIAAYAHVDCVEPGPGCLSIPIPGQTNHYTGEHIFNTSVCVTDDIILDGNTTFRVSGRFTLAAGKTINGRGVDGDNGDDPGESGQPGSAGKSFSLTATGDVCIDGTVDVAGGSGGIALSEGTAATPTVSGGSGANGGRITIDGRSDVSVQGSLVSSGGNGGYAGPTYYNPVGAGNNGGSGGSGGLAGSITISARFSLLLGAALNANGGSAGNGAAGQPGASGIAGRGGDGGNGGSGGSITVTCATLELTSGLDAHATGGFAGNSGSGGTGGGNPAANCATGTAGNVAGSAGWGGQGGIFSLVVTPATDVNLVVTLHGQITVTGGMGGSEGACGAGDAGLCPCGPVGEEISVPPAAHASCTAGGNGGSGGTVTIRAQGDDASDQLNLYGLTIHGRGGQVNPARPEGRSHDLT